MVTSFPRLHCSAVSLVFLAAVYASLAVKLNDFVFIFDFFMKKYRVMKTSTTITTISSRLPTVAPAITDVVAFTTSVSTSSFSEEPCIVGDGIVIVVTEGIEALVNESVGKISGSVYMCVKQNINFITTVKFKHTHRGIDVQPP